MPQHKPIRFGLTLASSSEDTATLPWRWPVTRALSVTILLCGFMLPSPSSQADEIQFQDFSDRILFEFTFGGNTGRILAISGCEMEIACETTFSAPSTGVTVVSNAFFALADGTSWSDQTLDTIRFRSDAEAAAKAVEKKGKEPSTCFAVQVGAYEDRAEATAMLNRLLMKAFPQRMTLTQVVTRDKTLWRLRVLATSRVEALKLSGRLLGEQGIKAWIVPIPCT